MIILDIQFDGKEVSDTPGFITYLWGGFDVRTTPQQLPVKLGGVAFMSSHCAELPCEGGSIQSSKNGYYVAAVQNSNAVSMKVQVYVPWIISCTTATNSFCLVLCL